MFSWAAGCGLHGRGFEVGLVLVDGVDWLEYTRRIGVERDKTFEINQPDWYMRLKG